MEKLVRLDKIQIVVNVLTIIVSYILMGVPNIRPIFVTINLISVILLLDAIKEYKENKIK